MFRLTGNYYTWNFGSLYKTHMTQDVNKPGFMRPEPRIQSWPWYLNTSCDWYQLKTLERKVIKILEKTNWQNKSAGWPKTTLLSVTLNDINSRSKVELVYEKQQNSSRKTRQKVGNFIFFIYIYNIIYTWHERQ